MPTPAPRFDRAGQLRAVLDAALSYWATIRRQSTAGHDLRGPLNAMILNLALLRDDSSKGSGPIAERERGVLIDALNAEVRRLDEMLKRSLLSREELGPVLPADGLDAHALVAGVVELVQPIATANRVELTADPPAAPVRARGEPERLRQLVIGAAAELLLELEPGARMTIGVVDGGDGVRIVLRATGATRSPSGSVGGEVARAAAAELHARVVASPRSDDGPLTIEILLPSPSVMKPESTS